jgi:hypothetical protein
MSCGFIPEERYDKRKTYGSLCSRDRYDEEYEYMPSEVLQKMTKGNETYINGIEHEFNGYEHDNDILSREKPEYPNHKYNSAEHQIPV